MNDVFASGGHRNQENFQSRKSSNHDDIDFKRGKSM